MPNDAWAMVEALKKASSRSASLWMAKMPRPPPPPSALSMFSTLRAGTRRDLLWRVNQLGLTQPFWKLADADSSAAVSALAYPSLEAITAIHLPEEWRNRGEDSARKLRELQCAALATLRKKPAV